MVRAMARYSGGPVTHRALTGPQGRFKDGPGWSGELLYTLKCVMEIRGKCNQTETSVVKMAREAGVSWAEIGAALGMSPGDAQARWIEFDQSVQR